MLTVLAYVFEIALFFVVLWLIAFLSTLLHELGHALGYRLAAGDGRWHIRVGSGKQLLKTRSLTVKLLPLDGYFLPERAETIDTKKKAVLTLAGGPLLSLLTLAALVVWKLCKPWEPGVLTSDAAASFFNTALTVNAVLFFASVLPFPYVLGENRGLASDGLQILRILKKEP